MPAPLSSAAIQSLWVQAQVRDTGYRPSLRETTLDFHVGYALTFVLGLCFLLLGAAVMAGPGTVLEAGAAGFAGQLIDLYAQTLGEWSRPVTGLAALAVMYSTLLALIDGLSRVSAALVLRARLPEEPEAEFRPAARGMLYLGCVFVISAGAVVILLTLVRSFRSLIDLATTIAFLTTPLIAYLVHRCMHAPEVPPEARPGTGMRRFSEACIGLLILFAGGYLLLLLVRG